MYLLFLTWYQLFLLLYPPRLIWIPPPLLRFLSKIRLYLKIQFNSSFLLKYHRTSHTSPPLKKIYVGFLERCSDFFLTKGGWTVSPSVIIPKLIIVYIIDYKRIYLLAEIFMSYLLHMYIRNNLTVIHWIHYNLNVVSSCQTKIARFLFAASLI